MAESDAGIVVVDAGPVIHLDELDGLDLFADLSPLVVPDVVWNEVRIHRPLLQPNRIPGLQVVPVHRSPSPRLTVFVDTLGLDAGETAALTLAEQQGNCMLLTDGSRRQPRLDRMWYPSPMRTTTVLPESKSLKQVRSALLHAAFLAHSAITCSRAWCADSPLRRVRLHRISLFQQNRK